jgi:deazaflavin-dependent oxidoreductase (nitroreductase family)
MGSTDVSEPAGRGRSGPRLLGLRRQPGRLALAIFRLPLVLHRRGWGRLLGDTFLVVVHVGRRSGRRHETAAMVLAHDPATQEAIVCSVWGERTDWIRNLRARPAVEVHIGGTSFTPSQRFLSEEERVAVAQQFRRRHPWRLRLLAAVFGWGDLRSDDTVRELVRTRPFVGLRPAPSP